MRDRRKGRGRMVLCEKERKSRKGGERLQHFGKRFKKKKISIT